MFLAAARALATHVTEADIAESAVFPQVATIRECSHSVACAVIRCAVEEGHADPEVLVNLEEVVRRAMWFPEYLPVRYEPHTGSGRRHAHS
jgi:malic enzyme